MAKEIVQSVWQLIKAFLSVATAEALLKKLKNTAKSCTY